MAPNEARHKVSTTIAANDKQWDEWKRLFDVGKPKGGEKKVATFLTEHPYLTVDTAFYDATFKDALLADDGIRSVLSEDEVNDIFDFKYHLKHVDRIFRKVGI